MDKSKSALAWGGVLLAASLWGGGAIVGRLLMEDGISPFSLALVRFSLGLPLLWGWQLRRAPRSHACARDRALVAATGIAMALSVVCWFAGIAALGAALATVIAICCAPAIVALVSVARGYERPTARLLLVLCLALTGVVLLVFPSSATAHAAGFGVGLAWSFAAAGLQALVVLGNARMPARVPAATAAAWSMSAAALCAALVAVPRGITWPSSALAWLGAAYTGVATTSIAYGLFAWGARHLTPTAAAIATMIEPLVATLLAAWLFGESLAPRQWLGGALLIAAVLSRGRPRSISARQMRRGAVCRVDSQGGSP